jgi:transposase
MRNIECYKLTICPYTPEFNPIERLFNTLKLNACDGVLRN